MPAIDTLQSQAEQVKQTTLMVADALVPEKMKQAVPAIRGIMQGTSDAMSSVGTAFTGITRVAIAASIGLNPLSIGLLATGDAVKAVTELTSGAVKGLISVKDTLYQLAIAAAPGGSRIIDQSMMLFMARLGTKLAPMLVLVAGLIDTLGDSFEDVIDSMTEADDFIPLLTKSLIQFGLGVLDVIAWILKALAWVVDAVNHAKSEAGIGLQFAGIATGNVGLAGFGLGLAGSESKDENLGDRISKAMKELAEKLNKADPAKFAENFGRNVRNERNRMNEIFGEERGRLGGTQGITDLWRSVQQSGLQTPFERRMLEINQKVLEAVEKTSDSSARTANALGNPKPQMRG